ncbi:MAG: 5-oxoprolinase subunit PxpA [Bryobacteraceae bacterium]
MAAIDLNCDVGEGFDDALVMPYITSANVACGGHAGDAETMRRTAELARAAGVKVGAHPGYPDRANFGRVALPLSPERIAETVYAQTAALAEAAGALAHLKPHGALYNVAARDAAAARAIAEGAARFDGGLVLFGLAGSVMLEVWREMGFRVRAEGFADRRYEPDGTLRPRKFPDALITDPAEAAAHALELAARVDTICVHGDTPGAARIARAVAEALLPNRSRRL